MLTIKRLVPRIAVPLATLAAIGIGVAITLGARHTPTVERIDFGRSARATTPAYDAALAPVSPAEVKEFRIPIEDTTIHIADGATYQAWTFGGTVPGPILRARVGDKVHVTVVNQTRMPHSIDFHAARIPPNIAYREIMPHDSVSFTFTPTEPGAFLVHCGTPPMLMHMMQGMYFAMIVDPRDGWGTKADKEFVLVQSEFYTKDASEAHGQMRHGQPEQGDGQPGASAHPESPASPPVAPDWKEAMEKVPSYVVFNGRAFQYKAHPLTVKVGDRVRFFVVNAGPNLNSDFHIVGAIFDRVYPDGDPAHALRGVQTYMVPAGGGAVFETVFDSDASGAGTYAFVTHSFADAEKGAMGMIRVVAPAELAATRH
ncbi:MAG TPA: multicopper oxidase domain-containing protein [Gemmatimonadaceae bacterium]|nr:multicopper oxidase domain-containing protein [Gemmatimonadaceae bacterium]